MEKIIEIASRMNPISLKEMDNVKLMDRTDTKYTFSIDELGKMLVKLQHEYRVLEINGKRICRYKTLYYDTSDLSLYNKHHSGKLNRYKIRHRTYVDSQTGFLEVKFKNNKSRTIKTRIKKNELPKTLQDDSADFLKSSLPFDPSILVPVVWVNYNRLTLVGQNSPERVTIDLGLEFITEENSRTFDTLVIAEVKQDSRRPSAFMNLMKTMHVREGSISKYCMAVAYSYKGIKTNNFKEKLLNLKRLTS